MSKLTEHKLRRFQAQILFTFLIVCLLGVVSYGQSQAKAIEQIAFKKLIFSEILSQYPGGHTAEVLHIRCFQRLLPDSANFICDIR